MVSKKLKTMKRTLYLLSISLIFFSCSKDSTNSATGTIQDVVGTYQYVADYSASNIQQPASTTPGYTACQQQSNITLDINNNGISEDYSLEDEMSGPCVSYSFTFLS